MQIDQVNRRYILVRALAALGCLIALQRCATKVPAADIARIKTVGVVSFAGGRFVMASVRPIAAGIRSANESADWGVDEIIVEEVTKALMPRYNVLPVTYDTGGLWRDFETMRASSAVLERRVPELVRKHVTPAAVGAYVVIWPIYEPYDPIGDALGLMNVPLGGVTLFDNRRITGTTTTLSTSFEMTVLDGQTFEQLASRQVSYPIESDTLHPQVGLVVESSVWADGFEMLTTDQKTKIQAILKVMLQAEIPATLKGMGITS